MWQRTKQQGKVGFDKVWGWADKLGDPVNKLSNKLGSEAFWPMSIDKESDKAARILSSFCSKPCFSRSAPLPHTDENATEEGFEKEASSSSLSLPAASTAPPPSPSPSSSSSGKLPDDPSRRPKGKQYVLNKIPPDVIRNAVGLAIFTTMRTGFYISGASGSGVLIARQADGSWSPPSGILLHTAGVGFLVGIDIYDCVLVINTAEALDAFCKVRCTVGGEISAAVGPVGAGGIVDSEVHKRRAPIFTYVKSRGFYAGVQMDGTVVIERSDENERFYGERVPVARILRGDVGNVPEEAVAPLWEAVKAAEGADAKLFPMTPEGRPVSGYVPRHRTMPSIN